MEQWLERVKRFVFPHSVEKQDIAKALAEWHYTGDTYDLEQPIGNCELCGHPDIRYQFTIRNHHNAKERLIGSECITRFDIPAVDERGVTLTLKETRKVVAKDRRKLITDAKERRMIQTLIDLKKKEEGFQVDSFINYFKERGAFTPKQLALVIWRLNANAVEYYVMDFKLTIKRAREKTQLLQLKHYQIEAIRPCLSVSQQRFMQSKGQSKLGMLGMGHRMK